jgi:hypothetical protein
MPFGDELVCHNCFGDEFLKKKINTEGKRGKCSYCGKFRIAVPIRSVADHYEKAFDDHYVRTPSGPSEFEEAMERHGIGGMWQRNGQPIMDVIQEIGDTSEEISTDIQELLEGRFITPEDYEMSYECEFHSDSCYEMKTVYGGPFQSQWNRLEEILKSESRYFSAEASKALQTIFEGIDQHVTFDGGAVIVDAGPNTSILTLFRARVFQTEEQLTEALKRPELSIGPPPKSVVPAGRMNAAGIQVFYGASEAGAALAEVRPPVGSRIVVAQFEIIRPLRLLDVDKLADLVVAGSVFDDTYILRRHKAQFMETLKERITMPVMPATESSDYLVTQAIADFLSSQSSTLIDGIIYPSVQVAGKAKNIVLFHKDRSLKRSSFLMEQISTSRRCETTKVGPRSSTPCPKRFRLRKRFSLHGNRHSRRFCERRALRLK